MQWKDENPFAEEECVLIDASGLLNVFHTLARASYNRVSAIFAIVKKSHSLPPSLVETRSTRFVEFVQRFSHRSFSNPLHDSHESHVQHGRHHSVSTASSRSLDSQSMIIVQDISRGQTEQFARETLDEKSTDYGSSEKHSSAARPRDHPTA